MAQASWSAPTRMVFLIHGEDPFRTRLRVGELVESLLAGGVGEPGDLSHRRSPQLGGALGLTRIDARSDPIDAITLAGQSQGLFAAVDERQVVLVEHAEALTTTEFLASFPSESALVLVAVEALRAGRGRARGRAKAGAPAELALPDAVQEIGGRAQRIERLLPFEVKGWIGARARLHQVTLQPDAIDALAYALGPDTERIENEVQKLGAYANGAPVTAVDVRALVSARRRERAAADPRPAPVAIPRAALRVHGAVERRRGAPGKGDPILAGRDPPLRAACAGPEPLGYRPRVRIALCHRHFDQDRTRRVG